MIAWRILPLLVLSALASPVRAQPAEDDAARARALFERAVPLLEAQRYGEARELLVEALALDPRASTAFNLASALTGLSRAQEAYDLLGRIERGELGEVPERYRENIETLRATIEAQLGQIEIRTSGADTVSIELDDVSVGAIESRSAIQRYVSPGSHRVRGTAEGFDPAEREVTVAAGERSRVLLELAPVETAAPSPSETANATMTATGTAEPAPAMTAAEDDDDAHGPGPGAWIGIGLGVAAIAAAAVIIGVLVGSGDSRAFACDAVFGCNDV